MTNYWQTAGNGPQLIMSIVKQNLRQCDETIIEKANILIESLPYIRSSPEDLCHQVRRRRHVDEGLKNAFAQDIVLLIL